MVGRRSQARWSHPTGTYSNASARREGWLHSRQVVRAMRRLSASCVSRRQEPAMSCLGLLSRLSVVAILIACACAGDVLAAPPRALPDGKESADVRLQPPKDLNGYFPLELPKSKEAWAERAE